MRSFTGAFAVVCALAFAVKAEAQANGLLLTLNPTNIVVAPGGQAFVSGTITNVSSDFIIIGFGGSDPAPPSDQFTLFSTFFSTTLSPNETLSTNAFFGIRALGATNGLPAAPGVYGPFGYTLAAGRPDAPSNKVFYQITVRANAPEPATFTLIIVGSAVLGVALRGFSRKA